MSTSCQPIRKRKMFFYYQYVNTEQIMHNLALACGFMFFLILLCLQESSFYSEYCGEIYQVIFFLLAKVRSFMNFLTFIKLHPYISVCSGDNILLL